MKPDFKIKIYYPKRRWVDVITAIVFSTHCPNNSEEFFAKTEGALLEQVAEWMEEQWTIVHRG
jgi:hypothetical protein